MHGDASAEFIAIISRQRSSSTMLSQAIAAHPCVAWANEIFHVAPAARLRRECGTQDRFSGRLLREHGKAALHASRFKHPVAFLRAVRELQLTVQWPKCGCKRASYAVVFKLFDRHLHGRLHESGLQDLLANPRTAVVVLEREAAGSECSLSWAKHSADWGALPARHSDAYATYKAAQCAAMPSLNYREAHTAWYGRVRGLLRELRKPFVDVSFNESTHELVNVLDRVYALARLSGGLELAEHTKLNLASVRAKVLNETCRAPPRLASHSCLERTRGAGVQSPRVKTRTRL